MINEHILNQKYQVKSYKTSRSNSHQKPNAQYQKRDFEGLYIHSSENFLNNDMNYLYQGGTPVGISGFQEQFKALPLSVAKINFKTEVKTKKFNHEYYNSDYPIYKKTTDFEVLSSRYFYQFNIYRKNKCSVVNLKPFEGCNNDLFEVRNYTVKFIFFIFRLTRN